jgi:hypothetical protein
MAGASPVSDSLGPESIKTAAAFGGTFGGVFFALRWLMDWMAKRFDKRQAQLDAEHATLDMSWKDYRLQLERRLSTLERQNNAFRLGFQHVSAALIRADPHNPALTIAEKIMAQAFPDDFSFSTAMAAGALDQTQGDD